MKSLVRMLVASVLLATSSQVAAYVLDTDGNGHPLHWAGMPVRYLLVAANVPGGPAGEGAVHAAFQTWNSASGNIDYTFGGFVSAGAQQFDNHNIVYWIYQNWPYDGTLAAITFRYYDTHDGHLLDADTVFNGAGFSWSVGGSGGTYDIQNSATHEVGHFSGLGHSPDRGATMYSRTYAGETSKRILSGDDIAGLDALYGGGQVVGPSGVASEASAGVRGGGGGCSIARSSDRAASLSDLLSMAALLAWMFRCSRGRGKSSAPTTVK